MIAIPPAGTPLPDAVYYCDRDECAEERSCGADELYWVPSWNGWYCVDCVDNDRDEIDEDDMDEFGDRILGIQLSQWLVDPRRMEPR